MATFLNIRNKEKCQIWAVCDVTFRRYKKSHTNVVCIILIQYKIATFRTLILRHACVYQCTFYLVSSPLVYHCRFDFVHMSAQSKTVFSSLTLCGLVCTESAHVWNRGFPRLTRFFYQNICHNIIILTFTNNSSEHFNVIQSLMINQKWMKQEKWVQNMAFFYHI